MHWAKLSRGGIAWIIRKYQARQARSVLAGRALNAEDALGAARAEIVAQRTRIGELLGQVRDLEAEWTKETIQRIATENTTLKQRVRQFTTGQPHP